MTVSREVSLASAGEADPLQWPCRDLASPSVPLPEERVTLAVVTNEPQRMTWTLRTSA
jgi:hypothetical protein